MSLHHTPPNARVRPVRAYPDPSAPPSLRDRLVEMCMAVCEPGQDRAVCFSSRRAIMISPPHAQIIQDCSWCAQLSNMHTDNNTLSTPHRPPNADSRDVQFVMHADMERKMKKLESRKGTTKAKVVAQHSTWSCLQACRQFELS